MKKNVVNYARLRSIMYFFVFLVLFVAPMAFAATVPTPDINIRINNPLGSSITTLPSFIEAVLGIVMVIGVPIVALAIIYSGFLFVTASGNSEKLSEAKKTLMYTLIGAALLLGSWVIAKAIQGTIAEINRTV